MLLSRFDNRQAILATMHRKEQVIAPLFEQALGLTVRVIPHLDTDTFGTFTREVPRPGTQIEAARLKAQRALELTGTSLAIASEGTFFPDPMLPWGGCDREIVILLDREQDFEIVAEVTSRNTNYAQQTVATVEAALAFAERVGFPEHGLVVMEQAKQSPKQALFKGITAKAELIEAVQTLLNQQGTAHLETDMRALYNPTRMQVIAQATQRLIQKLQQPCPRCGYPGFDVVKHLPGLPCSWCRRPTSLIQQEVHQCMQCDYSETKMPPHGLTDADPAHCPNCNP
jgi:hypothetical protein